MNYLSSQVSPKSLKNYIMLLNVLFKTAIQLNIIPKGSNPTMDVVKPKLRKNQIEAYNLEEFNLILKLAETDNNPDIKLILNLALLSGIRRGEMAALKWSDINFKEKYIYIHECRIVLEKQELISAHIMSTDRFNTTQDYSFLSNVLAEGEVLV